MASFTHKKIEVRFTLDKERFKSGRPSKVVRNLACEVQINKGIPPEKNSARIAVYNMLREDMELLTTLGFRQNDVRHNTVDVYAGDDEDGMVLAFTGDIRTAIPEFSGVDDVFNVECVTGYFQTLVPQAAFSSQGSVDVGMFMRQAAGAMGLSFRNMGVNKAIRDPYLTGSWPEKARAVAEQARIQLFINDNELVIMPSEGSIYSPGDTVVWTPDNGLVGSPVFTDDGIIARGLYSNRLKPGGLLTIQSAVPKASGTWKILTVQSSLSCRIHNGPWFSQVQARYRT